jgi:hypothetical protein
MVTAADAAAIRAAFDTGGEWLAAAELRRLFPGVEDTDEARRWARAIADWQPIVSPTSKPRAKRRSDRS